MVEKLAGIETSETMLNAYFQAAFPIDRTLDVSIPLQKRPNRDAIDSVILKAMYIAPVFSDFYLVSEKVTPGELSAVFCDIEDKMFSVISDDCLIIIIGSRIEYLLTITSIPIDGRISYQVSFHAFKINFLSTFIIWTLHQVLNEYGILSYADCELIDKYQVNGFGRGAPLYVNDPLRSRPVFISRKPTNFTRNEKHYLRYAMNALLPFGLTLKNDDLFEQYAAPLKAKKLDIVGIPPAEASASNKLFSKNLLDLSDLDAERAIMPDGVDYFLDKLPLRKPDYAAYMRLTDLSKYSKNFFKLWPSSTDIKLQLNSLRKSGLVAERDWAELLRSESSSEKNSNTADIAQTISDDSGLSGKRVETQKISLDSDGYPTDSRDLVAWSQRTLGENIVILTRARQVLKKFRHPDPRRIAQALELLGGPKLKTYLGDRKAQNAVDSMLIALRMKDGFSNAELLQGQFGDDYKVNYCGKPALLSRHLATVSSGFNDPKLIRIYYFFDKISKKIVIGWLPTHLPTTQS